MQPAVADKSEGDRTDDRRMFNPTLLDKILCSSFNRAYEQLRCMKACLRAQAANATAEVNENILLEFHGMDLLRRVSGRRASSAAFPPMTTFGAGAKRASIGAGLMLRSVGQEFCWEALGARMERGD